jgi:hypothetical protein
VTRTHRIVRPAIEKASIICQSESIRAVYGGMLTLGKTTGAVKKKAPVDHMTGAK